MSETRKYKVDLSATNAKKIVDGRAEQVGEVYLQEVGDCNYIDWCEQKIVYRSKANNDEAREISLDALWDLLNP